MTRQIVENSTTGISHAMMPGACPLASMLRFDTAKPSVKGSQDHVHFKNGSALNKDGTWKDGKSFKLSKNEKKYLQNNGWKTDKKK